MRNQNDGVTIRLSAPDLEMVEFIGVGDVHVKDLTCRDLRVALRGVGSADIHVVCDYLSAKVGGVGEITLSGTAGHADISKGGIGGVNTCNLKVGR